MADPCISIVSGTYDRLQYLQNMIQTARRAFPAATISYEFVIVDGGSEDGTLDWLRQQPDVQLIEDGRLTGAISAFTRAARAARGEYVVLANDDIAFYPESITRALVWLQDHPACGAVAFEDNRRVAGDPPPPAPVPHRVKGHCVRLPDGTARALPYAQVGMFPRWLGDLMGWWGADDPQMEGARTYGGDNYLSARIVEAGYAVEACGGARVDDYVVTDGLRVENVAVHQRGTHGDSAIFRKRFPSCPQLREEPQHPNLSRRQPRVLYLPIYEPGQALQRRTKRGLREALCKIGLVYEFDYLADEKNAARQFLALVETWKPDLILTQLQNSRPITAQVMAQAKQAWPTMTCINWNGDAWRHDSHAYIKLLQQFDVHLVVDGAALARCEAHGIRAAYWQIGYEDASRALPEMPAHDVVFLGNNYNRQRSALEHALHANGRDVGLYGRGWRAAAGECLYDFDAGAALYGRAQIAVGDTFPNSQAFVSNRFFQALAAGAFLLQQQVPALEIYNPGLIDGEHYVSWSDLGDLQTKLAFWLDGRRRRTRDRIAAAGQGAVRAHYSFDAQVRKLFYDILPEVIDG